MATDRRLRREIWRYKAVARVTARSRGEEALARRGFLLWRLGELLFESGRVEEAVRYAAQAATVLEDLPTWHALAMHARARQGIGLYTLGRLEESLAVLDEVIVSRELVPELLDGARPELRGMRLPDAIAGALAGKVFTLERLGRRDEADAIADILIDEFDPGMTQEQRLFVAKAFLRRGRFARLRGEVDIAMTALDDALSRGSEVANADFAQVVSEALIEQGLLLEVVGRNDEALAAFDEVVRRFGSASEPWLQEAVGNAVRSRTRLTSHPDEN